MKKAKNLNSVEELDLLENLFEFIVPKYREAHDIIVSMLDSTGQQNLRIADLGCGFGELSKRILQMIPGSIVFGLDNNPRILKKCRERLADYGDRFMPFERNLNRSDWYNDFLPLDAIVSSFTLDYLTLDRHKRLISEVFSSVNPQGRFITCEFFKSGDERINRVFHDLEIQFIHNSLNQGKVTKEQIDQLTKSDVLRQDHHICTVDTKVEWLRTAGFDRVEVPWRFLNLAVISAVR